MKPLHFFIIGGQRCGTTYLYQLLDEHPEIQMARPVSPEPKYFLEKHTTEFNQNNYFNKYFKADSSVKCFGEKSTSYIESIDAAKKINSAFPDARIIVMLRNPVNRAISNYLFTSQNGLDSRTMNEVFLENQPAPGFDSSQFSTNPFHYFERGIYYKYLKNWFSLFSEKQIKVLIFEQFVGQINRIADLYDWLNVDSAYVPPSLEQKINSVNSGPESNLNISKVIAPRYIFHNQQLSQFIGTDLSFWNKYL